MGLLGADAHGSLADLMAEMQAHYRVPRPDRADILSGLAGLPQGIEVLVAHDGTALVGFAFAANVYPGPGLKSGFFLKELYVARAARGAGIGRALMRALAELALAHGHRRIDWTADAANPGLLRFYESLGAVAQTEKIFYRLTGEALAQMANDPDTQSR
ncbi:acetyltransferase [Bosea sp. PAMC 26642]|nr:acetyltransferase [Bosea sp. PAMC 26642]